LVAKAVEPFDCCSILSADRIVAFAIFRVIDRLNMHIGLKYLIYSSSDSK